MRSTSGRVAQSSKAVRAVVTARSISFAPAAAPRQTWAPVAGSWAVKIFGVSGILGFRHRRETNLLTRSQIQCARGFGINRHTLLPNRNIPLHRAKFLGARG